MHHVGGSLPVESVPDGTTLLVVGPPMTGKRSLAYRVLAGSDDGDATTVLVTTDVGGTVTVGDYERSGGSVDPERFCVLDATGADVEETRVHAAERPTDVAGIGVQTAALLADLSDRDGAGRGRVCVASLTTLARYGNYDGVVGFLHVLTEHVDDVDGLGVVIAHSDTLDAAQRTQLETLVDGVVELRETDGGSECRVRGVTDEPTGWTAIEAPTDTAVEDADGTPAERWPTARESDPVESLPALVATVETERPTLTLLNYDGPAATRSRLEEAFGRMNVAVREAETADGLPADVALLHRGEDLLASTSVSDVESALSAAESDVDAFEESVASPILSTLTDSETFGARGVDKRFMTDVSHAIEMRAWRTGTGTLHAGFQRLSRLVNHPDIRRIYERLADSGVDVHVYGLPDADVAIPGVTVHASQAEELLECWFVVFDGGHRRQVEGERAEAMPRHAGTLLAEERDPEEYYGFWTYQPEMADRVGKYLAETYPDSDADRESDSVRT